MGNVLYHDCFLTVTSVMTSIHNAEGRLSQAEPCERSVLRPMGLVSWNLLNLFPQRFSNFSLVALMKQHLYFSNKFFLFFPLLLHPRRENPNRLTYDLPSKKPLAK